AGDEPEPLVYPPGCSHTMTGRRSLADFAAVQTFRNRQSSLMCGAGPRPPAACIQMAPNSSALRMPSQCGAGWGGFQRKSPTGGAANGIPLNTRTSASLPATPDIRPVSIFTGSFIAAHVVPAARRIANAARDIKALGACVFV